MSPKNVTYHKYLHTCTLYSSGSATSFSDQTLLWLVTSDQAVLIHMCQNNWQQHAEATAAANTEQHNRKQEMKIDFEIKLRLNSTEPKKKKQMKYSIILRSSG